MIVLLSRFPHALVVLLLVWLGGVSASSAPPRPLKRIAHPSTLSLQIVPRRPPIRARSVNASPNPDYPFYPQSDATRLLHSDSFRLTLAAFGDIIHLHLRPTANLIHPAARVNYYRTDGDGQSILDRTVPLRREDLLVYEGEVFVADEASEKRMREDAAGGVRGREKERYAGKYSLPLEPDADRSRGWARIMIHDQGNSLLGRPPLWEGAFTLNGVIHHVVQRDQYMRTRNAHDPTSPFIHDEDTDEYYDMDTGLVIFRDSDVMTPSEEEAFLREGRKAVALAADLDLDDSYSNDDVSSEPKPAAHSCSHDRLPYNNDPFINPLLRPEVDNGVTSAKAWYDPFGVFAPTATGDAEGYGNETMHSKRQDVVGGNTGTNFVNTIGDTTGCSKTQKIVYMGVAADCTYVSNHATVQNATAQIINNWNMASSLYKNTFNVSLGILHIDIQDPTCPPTGTGDASRPWNTPCGTVTLNDRLSLFSAWRGTLGDDGTGLWHLMSGCPTGTEVGVAWLGTLCQQDASGRSPTVVSGTAVSTNARTEWQIVSHEIGHNFGAIHDCQDGCSANSGTACCPLNANQCNANDAFIMSPVTSSSQTVFSQCSLGNICSLMSPSSQNNLNINCLLDPDPTRQTLSLGMCGNGIVESGEDCDPGIAGNNTSSPCCDPSTCKFRTGAVCDPMSSDCCTLECQFAPSTTVCRPAVDSQCDTAETCSGTSAWCPKDEFAPNGQSCGSGNGTNLACAGGVCTSPDQQCSLVGASMGLTRACVRVSNTCQLQCQDPTNSNVCIQLQAELIDGSPCGYGGTCSKGVCETGGILATARAWYLQNLQISIPVTIVAGIVALMLIWGLITGIRRCCRRNRNRPNGSTEPAMAGYRGQRISSWQAPLMGPIEPPVIHGVQNANQRPSPQHRHSRNLSVPAARTSGGPFDGAMRNVPPSSYNQNAPMSQRNRSWDSAYGNMPASNANGRRQSGRQSQLRSNWVDPSLYNGPLR